MIQLCDINRLSQSQNVGILDYLLLEFDFMKLFDAIKIFHIFLDISF